MAKTCECGNKVPAKGGGAVYENDYCSRYCREFYSRGLKKIPKSSSKHHKNQLKFPVIDCDCLGCGKSFEITAKKSDKGRHQAWCSQQCLDKVRGAPVRRASITFTMLALLKHRGKYGIYGGWMNHEEVFNIMQNFDNSSGKNSFTSLLPIWHKKGVLEKKDRQGDRRAEYRMSDWGLRTPLGKVFFEAKNLKWEE